MKEAEVEVCGISDHSLSKCIHKEKLSELQCNAIVILLDKKEDVKKENIIISTIFASV